MPSAPIRTCPHQSGVRQSGVAERSHVGALDGLRGVAVAAVLLFHTGAMPGGFLGVDLFFVLSGFLITGLLLREVHTDGHIALTAFWGRRLRRLFPALAVVLSMTAFTVWALAHAGAAIVPRGVVSTTLSDGFWVQLNLVNWHLLADDASYWQSFGQARVFEHLWSIAVEEQFYVVWPLVVVAGTWLMTRWGHARPRTERFVLGTALTLSVGSLALMIVLLDPMDPTRVYTGSDTRAFSLLLGAAAATAPVRHLLARLVAVAPQLCGWITGAVSIGIGLTWIFVDGTSTPGLFTGGLFVHALACAPLIGLCAAFSQRPSRSAPGAPVVVRALQTRPLRWLGTISYSLYLWHWPVMVLLPTLGNGTVPRLVWSALAVGISCALAAASRRWVEDPIRYRARWARGRAGLLAFGTASTALLAMWFLLPEPAAPVIDIDGL